MSSYGRSALKSMLNVGMSINASIKKGKVTEGISLHLVVQTVAIASSTFHFSIISENCVL